MMPPHLLPSPALDETARTSYVSGVTSGLTRSTSLRERQDGGSDSATGQHGQSHSELTPPHRGQLDEPERGRRVRGAYPLDRPATGTHRSMINMVCIELFSGYAWSLSWFRILNKLCNTCWTVSTERNARCHTISYPSLTTNRIEQGRAW